MNRKPTSLKLSPDDCAFVLRSDGGIEMFIPDNDGDDLVPDYVLAMMMLSFQVRGADDVFDLAEQFRQISKDHGVGQSFQ